MPTLEAADADLAVLLDSPGELVAGRMSFIGIGEIGGLDSMLAAATRRRLGNGEVVADADFAEALPDQPLSAGIDAPLWPGRGSAVVARWRHVQDFVLPGCLAAMIGIVLALTNWTGPDSTVTALENRAPAPLPPAPRSLAAIAHYPQRFGDFFADRFGLRRQMVALRALALEALGQSPSPLVLLGRRGWLFFAGDGSLEAWMHRAPLSAAELEQWATRLGERERWFAAHGIAYLFVVAPDKHTVYPEYLPRYLRPGPGATRLDQLRRRLTGDPHWLDLRAAVQAAKPAGQVYFLGDTHWNDFGAYTGYRAIMQRLGLPALARPPASLQQVRHVVDLARMFGLAASEPDTLPPLACAVARPIKPDADGPAPPGPAPTEPVLRATTCAGGRGRLLVFHDSFVPPMSAYLSDSFARAVYVWRRPTLAEMQRMAAAEHPTVVIEERVERFLNQPLDP
jgi:alginate O-acetyltransferase complex protein AlgJ